MKPTQTPTIQRRSNVLASTVLAGSGIWVAIISIIVLAGCSSAPQQRTTADISACYAEYDASTYLGTEADYRTGCLQFASIREW